jgi:hypothetical protein
MLGMTGSPRQAYVPHVKHGSGVRMDAATGAVVGAYAIPQSIHIEVIKYFFDGVVADLKITAAFPVSCYP